MAGRSPGRWWKKFSTNGNSWKGRVKHITSLSYRTKHVRSPDWPGNHRLHTADKKREMPRTKIKVRFHLLIIMIVFANINLLRFCCSPPTFLLLWSRNFATTVTWRHTSPLSICSFSPVPLGSIPELPAESCKEVMESEEQAVSGNYWLYTIKENIPVLAHCNMETFGKF